MNKSFSNKSFTIVIFLQCNILSPVAGFPEITQKPAEFLEVKHGQSVSLTCNAKGEKMFLVFYSDFDFIS